MDVKRYFRGPVMWIVLAVLAVVVLMQVVGSSGGYKTVDTGQVVQAINENQVESAKLTTGDEQIIKVELKDGQKIEGSNKIQASYIGDQGVDARQTRCRPSTRTGEIPDGLHGLAVEAEPVRRRCCSRCSPSSSSSSSSCS